MIVRVNGANREVDERATISGLLAALGVDPVGVAVAIDGEVVPRGRHDDTALSPGAVVEVIRAVGGG